MPGAPVSYARHKLRASEEVANAMLRYCIQLHEWMEQRYSFNADTSGTSGAIRPLFRANHLLMRGGAFVYWNWMRAKTEEERRECTCETFCQEPGSKIPGDTHPLMLVYLVSEESSGNLLIFLLTDHETGDPIFSAHGRHPGDQRVLPR